MKNIRKVRKNPTWTVQADEATVALVNQVLGEHPEHGKKSELLRNALRLHLPEAALNIAADELETAKREIARLSALLKKARPPKPSPSQRALRRASKVAATLKLADAI